MIIFLGYIYFYCRYLSASVDTKLVDFPFPRQCLPDNLCLRPNKAGQCLYREIEEIVVNTRDKHTYIRNLFIGK